MSQSLSSREKGKGKEVLVPSSSTTLSETDLALSSSRSSPQHALIFRREKLGSASSASSSSALSSSGSSSSDSDSDDDSDSDSDYDSDVPNEVQIAALLEKAKAKARLHSSATAKSSSPGNHKEEEVIKLDGEDGRPPLPALDPGLSRYTKTNTNQAIPKDPSASEPHFESYIPTPPPPPKDTSITKAQRKAIKKQTAGPDWFDLPAPAEADLPKLYREVEALRLRNQLDPKRFYRKDEGEGKGIKGLPKYFAIGTVMSTPTPFGSNGNSENLSRAERKRTLVDELVDDAEAKRYAKKKFDDLQRVRGAKGRGTLHKKKESRKPKW